MRTRAGGGAARARNPLLRPAHGPVQMCPVPVSCAGRCALTRDGRACWRRGLRWRFVCAQTTMMELAMKGKGDCAYSLTCVTSFSKMVNSMGR